MEYYVSVEKRMKEAVLRVRDDGNRIRRYPLTKAGCLQAGRDLFADGVENWMNSSSVDFPQEVKPGFKHDVRELMTQGFQEEQAKADAPRKSMINKVMEFVRGSQDFLKGLTPEEFKAFYDMDERIKAGG